MIGKAFSMLKMQTKLCAYLLVSDWKSVIYVYKFIIRTIRIVWSSILFNSCTSEIVVGILKIHTYTSYDANSPDYIFYGYLYVTDFRSDTE